ncbi:SIS domain-containing protein [Candidatus Enterococcus ferrettii]|uniref:6-phospho 3-hexuloisomerase n=1 Tax=Candidatus Enterococcus ferrettii TaxID=2815324 RepID=A0ABV0EYL5_9ENTE|nr:SIS domain-containing protein [Enterococcus sp. 665A]MBO1339351.1 SIS domain-containing protein [Enterococcus sp. 665A]
MKTYYENTQAVMKELGQLLGKVSQEQITSYAVELLQAEQVFFIGVGRVRLALEAAVKRLTHLGIHCHMVGDLNEPPITRNDLLVVGSGSGESVIPLEIAKKAKGFDARIVHLTSNSTSSIAQLADVIVQFESPSKSSRVFTSIQPMTTVFEQALLLFHDVLTLQLMEEKGISFEELKANLANLE